MTSEIDLDKMKAVVMTAFYFGDDIMEFNKLDDNMENIAKQQIKKGTKSLEELFEDYNEDYSPVQIDWGENVGKEKFYNQYLEDNMENINNNGYKCLAKLHPTLLKLTSISKAECCMTNDWEWRLDYVGSLGLATFLTVTEGKYKGMVKICIKGEVSFRTGVGTLLIDGKTITLRTKNSIWVFEDTGLLPSFFAGINDISGSSD